jgi:hypothetical protein
MGGYDKTGNKRKVEHRERMREAGFVLKQVWVHPDDWPALQRMIERRRKKRAGADA